MKTIIALCLLVSATLPNQKLDRTYSMDKILINSLLDIYHDFDLEGERMLA